MEDRNAKEEMKRRDVFFKVSIQVFMSSMILWNVSQEGFCVYN